MASELRTRSIVGVALIALALGALLAGGLLFWLLLVVAVGMVITLLVLMVEPHNSLLLIN